MIFQQKKTILQLRKNYYFDKILDWFAQKILRLFQSSWLQIFPTKFSLQKLFSLRKQSKTFSLFLLHIISTNYISHREKTFQCNFLLYSRERRWNLSSNQRLQIIHHLEISLDYPRKIVNLIYFSSWTFFRLTASITLKFLYLFVVTSISVGIATELHTAHHTNWNWQHRTDNYEPICWLFCFVFVSFFSFDIRRKRRILIFTSFFCHKTRQLIGELFKKSVYNFTRAPNNQ